MTTIRNVSRRDFLHGLAVGGGFVLVASLPGCRRVSDQLAGGAAGSRAFNPSVFVSMDETGAVTIVAHRSEMGQGVRTSLPMAVADEMEADWARVRVAQAPGDEKTYGDQNTDGSQSVRHFLQPMREIGATARTMLERAAAKHWKVPVSEVRARSHQVLHVPSGRTVEFGALVPLARDLPVPKAGEVTLKAPSAFRYIGKEVPIVDLLDMTTGRAGYGIDHAVPGMKYAVVERPPVYGGTVASVDESAARAVPGVERVVRIPATPPPSGFQPLGGVAVVARSTWAALQGRAKLGVTWADGPNGTYDSPAYAVRLAAAARAPGKVARDQGDAARALAGAARRVAADYYVPHLAHAMMEPEAAVASFADGRCEVWTSTQNPQGARDQVAKGLGISAERVTVHVTLLGGGFGRKSKPDYVVEAALLSRDVGAPVKVMWTRQDDIRHGYYHPPSAQHLEGGLDAHGAVVAWLHRSAFPSIGSTFAPNVTYASASELGMGMTDLPYDIPNIRCENGPADPHVRIGWYRSVMNIHHAFAVGSFADELAHAAGRDPKDFLLALIGPPRQVDLAASVAKPFNYGEDFATYPIDTARLRRVVEVAADAAQWGRTLPRGHGLGVAVHRSFVTYVATVVEVAVERGGTLVVPRVVTAVDCGFVAHPERTRAQLEGAAVMAMGNALYGEITFARGRAQQGNYDDYRVVRIDAAPRRTEVHIVPSDAPPGGVGEPGVPPFAPALCNAIFAATGKRIRRLPVGSQLAT